MGMDLNANGSLSGRYEVEPLPDWQEAAIASISKLSEFTCADTLRKETARAIVRSIEADCIAAPKAVAGPGDAITLLFLCDQRSVEFAITAPGVFHVILWSPYERSRKTHHKGWPGEAARRAIRWLYPSSHSTVLDDKGIERVLREGL